MTLPLHYQGFTHASAKNFFVENTSSCGPRAPAAEEFFAALRLAPARRRFGLGGRRPTDAPVSIHRARGQAGGAASLAPSCQPGPRYSRCGYPCAPMWLRMPSRLRWREQYQTGLPLCDAHHSWTSLQGQERQRQADVLVPANRGADARQALSDVGAHQLPSASAMQAVSSLISRTQQGTVARPT